MCGISTVTRKVYQIQTCVICLTLRRKHWCVRVLSPTHFTKLDQVKIFKKPLLVSMKNLRLSKINLFSLSWEDNFFFFFFNIGKIMLNVHLTPLMFFYMSKGVTQKKKRKKTSKFVTFNHMIESHAWCFSQLCYSQ